MHSPDADSTKRSILDAALAILTEEGHHALSVRRVAARAGCSTIGVYTWFGGKDGLVDALWIEAFESFGDALKRARKASGPLGRMVGQARAYRSWALAHPAHYQLLFFNVIPEHQPSAEAAAAAAGAYSSLLAAIEAAKSSGELGPLGPVGTGTRRVEKGRVDTGRVDAIDTGMVDAIDTGMVDTGTVAHVCWAMVHGLVSLELTNSGPEGVTDSHRANTKAFNAAVNALVAGLTRR